MTSQIKISAEANLNSDLVGNQTPTDVQAASEQLCKQQETANVESVQLLKVMGGTWLCCDRIKTPKRSSAWRSRTSFISAERLAVFLQIWEQSRLCSLPSKPPRRILEPLGSDVADSDYSHSFVFFKMRLLIYLHVVGVNKADKGYSTGAEKCFSPSC